MVALVRTSSSSTAERMRARGARLALAASCALSLAARADGERASTTPASRVELTPPTHIGPAGDAPVVDGDPTRATVEEAIARMRRGVRETKSSRCTFLQQEYVGKMLAPSTIELLSRADGAVYMRWTEGPVKGREVLYRSDRRDGDLLVKHGFLPAITVDPTGMLARQGNRHTVLEAGLVKVAERILEDADRLVKLPRETARYAFLGEKTVHGQRVACWRTEVDRDRYPALYAHHTEICADTTTGLPVTIRAWSKEDGALRLVEDYAFTKCRLNTLTDLDFDEENEAYSF